MTEDDVVSLLHDQKRFLALLQDVFPSASWDEDTLARAYQAAQISRDPRTKPLIGLDTLSESAKLALEKQKNAPAHTMYAIEAGHHRNQPFQSEFIEQCQAVRVTLPATDQGEHPIWTRLGVVRSSDHLLFSIEGFCAAYEKAFQQPAPSLGRVDLITGARHLDLARFSPVSIYLAFENESDEKPLFFFLESGSVTGRPEVLYFTKTMNDTLHTHAGFAFTPFACAANWYTSRLTMDDTGTEPSALSISVAQEKDGGRHYLNVSLAYQVQDPKEVICPGAQAIVAVLRVFALGLGLEFDKHLIMSALGEWSRKHLPWGVVPPEKGSPDGYLGCN